MANATATTNAYTTKEAILGAVAAGKLGVDEAGKLLASLITPKQALHAKVSEKGAVSVYGLQRVTIYLPHQARTRLFFTLRCSLFGLCHFARQLTLRDLGQRLQQPLELLDSIRLFAHAIPMKPASSVAVNSR